MTVIADVPSTSIDPYSLEFLADPHPQHEMLRELGAVVWLERYGIYAMARFGEVSAALHDWETFISSAGVGLEDLREGNQWRPPSLLLETDPPEHAVARRLATSVLSLPAVREMREHFVAVARELITDLVRRERFDAVPDLAIAYPMAVFPEAMGLQEEGRENLLPYASMAFNAFGPQNELYLAAREGLGDSATWTREQARRGATRAGSIGDRIHETAADTDVPRWVAGGVVTAFLTAGLDTTMHALGTAVRLLAENPDQWERLKANPALARPAFEESIRVDSPVQTFARTTTRDVDVAGARIPRDAKVLLFLGSANRDPRRWDEPERFVIDRKVGGHVGFGYGIHACVGQMLARLEGEAVLTALAEQVDTIRLDGDVEYELNNTLRGMHSLPIAMTGSTV